ncbi:uncharacterized protein LOC114867063 [Betta splendens]|uniref:Uncharacterized protein LOC114867063 n=1 Tax=Betta splendens TaxID=158456 RepID=A0A9W2X9S3_BETSP|nr:uncharacterized protein LOC114867063 [Betta splendens]
MELHSRCLTLLLYCVLELQAARLHVHPNTSQFFWYESVTLSCVVAEKSSNWDSWTLKRNTSNQIDVPCSRWGVSNKSSCKIENAYPADSGMYWCESESGESSNTLNVTISASTVILESPALPVTEGDTVTLSCHHKEEFKHKTLNNFSANFFKNGVFIGNARNITFSAASKADEGFYKCGHPTGVESPQSWLSVTSKVNAPPASLHLLSLPRVIAIIILIVIYKLILIVCVKMYRKWSRGRNPVYLRLLYCVLELQAARLHVNPNRSQFFLHQSVTLSCVVAGKSSNLESWTLKRNTSKKMSESCSSWEESNKSSCTMEDPYPADSGMYWCESESGESSNTLKVTISASTVILESPALPVTEGDTVTLSCHHKEEFKHKTSNNFSANFFKNDVFIGNARNITFSAVSKADEGFYKCGHPTGVESPQSWLSVTSKVNAAPASLHLLSLPRVIAIIILIVIYKLILVVCVIMYRKWSRGRNPVHLR